MNRINKKMNEDKKLLSIYFTAGYPNLNDTKRIYFNIVNRTGDNYHIGSSFETIW